MSYWHHQAFDRPNIVNHLPSFMLNKNAIIGDLRPNLIYYIDFHITSLIMFCMQVIFLLSYDVYINITAAVLLHCKHKEGNGL